jgi:hypothetical protein
VAELVPQSHTNSENHQAGALSTTISHQMARRLLFLPDHARNMGIHLMGGKGSGKSRLMGRLIAWHDFLRGVPLVIIDPYGATIDNFLDKLTRLPAAHQQHLWSRVIYVDMSGGSGSVIPFPLYYRLGDESLYQMSQRYLDVVRKADPWLATASIEGWNPLWWIGTNAGMILSALDFQITEAEHLLRYPKSWSQHFTHAMERHPEVRPAVEFFTQRYARWKEEMQARRSASFLNKISIFTLDPTMKAMFGASCPGIDWERVVSEGCAVLLDFRHDIDIELRRFKMLWAFTYFLDFIKHRGAGRHRPVSLIIDELSALYNFHSLALDIFAADLDELINVIARNHMVWLTLAHQELFQLNERAQKSLMTMGTQIFGSSADIDGALTLARQFFRYDPDWIKRCEPVYASYHGFSQIIDYRTVDFTVEEQALLTSYRVKDQGRFHFLVRPAFTEGEAARTVVPMTIQNLDRGEWVNEELVGKAREILSRRQGRRVGDVLDEIEGRLKRKSISPLSTRSRQGTMVRDEESDHIPGEVEAEGIVLREPKQTTATDTSAGETPGV